MDNKIFRIIKASCNFDVPKTDKKKKFFYELLNLICENKLESRKDFMILLKKNNISYQDFMKILNQELNQGKTLVILETLANDKHQIIPLSVAKRGLNPLTYERFKEDIKNL